MKVGSTLLLLQLHLARLNVHQQFLLDLNGENGTYLARATMASAGMAWELVAVAALLLGPIVGSGSP